MLARHLMCYDLPLVVGLAVVVTAGCAKPASRELAPQPRDAAAPATSLQVPASVNRTSSRAAPTGLASGVLRATSCAYVGVEDCRRLCDGKDYASCGALALLYANGWGVTADESRALELAKTSCTHNSATGCGLLGSFYGSGVGVDRDTRRATELLKFGCEAEDALSCESLGGQAVDASFGPIDLETAANYFLKACGLGHLRACFKAGATIQDGQLQTSQRPTDLYAKSCQGGFATACFLLGTNLESGFEARPDPAGADAAFARACELGNQKACVRRGRTPNH